MTTSLPIIASKPFSDYLYVALLSCARYLNVLMQKSQDKNASSILCYHSISNDGWRYATTISDFTSQIDYLSRKRKIVSLAEVIKSKNITNQISLTFDDGYEDFLINALPILNKYNVKGTLFILGTPETANRKALDNQKTFLSLTDIKIIKKLGWEIGFHTNTHTSLTNLTTEQLKKEIIEGKKNLEKKLGFKLRYFAYPMGEYSQKVINVVNEAGFEAAFSTNGGSVSTNNAQDMHIIDRVCLEGNLTFDQFKTLLTPTGLAFNKIFMNIIKIKAALSNIL